MKPLFGQDYQYRVDESKEEEAEKEQEVHIDAAQIAGHRLTIAFILLQVLKIAHCKPR